MARKRNPVAKILRRPRFRLRVLRNRMKYFRKAKHPKRERDENYAE